MATKSSGKIHIFQSLCGGRRSKLNGRDPLKEILKDVSEFWPPTKVYVFLLFYDYLILFIDIFYFLFFYLLFYHYF